MPPQIPYSKGKRVADTARCRTESVGCAAGMLGNELNMRKVGYEMEQKMTVLVLLPVQENHRDYLESCAPGAEFVYTSAARLTREQLGRAQIILGNPPSGRIGECQSLRLLQLSSAGTDGFTGGVLPKGAVLTNSTGAYGLAISEHMLGVTLQLMKNLSRYQDNQRAHRWESCGGVQGIAGSTALIIGLGDIGCEYAKRFRALGGRTIGVRRSAHGKPEEVDEIYQIDALDGLLSQADVVALSVPGGAATYHLMNTERISKMKPSAILLNVGRGTAVDTDALCEALRQGRILGAGLDVTDPEPLPPGHPLWDCPNALITPHVSGGYQLPETFERVVRIAGENLRRFLAGTALLNEVDGQTGYTVPQTKAHFEGLLGK